jgi:NTP pyrophosphatase (non-canonical NTP hydrolase)
MEFKEIEKLIENFGKDDVLYWSNALAGEVGEYCNLMKKFVRDDSYPIRAIKYELADVFIYLILNARFHKIDLEQAILEKLEVIKKRRIQNMVL